MYARRAEENKRSFENSNTTVPIDFRRKAGRWYVQLFLYELYEMHSREKSEHDAGMEGRKSRSRDDIGSGSVHGNAGEEERERRI